MKFAGDRVAGRRVVDAAGTREHVVRSLLADGPATAAGLAARLGLTSAAVRRHLDLLCADGLVEARERPPYGPVGRRGRGRPARVFTLTEAGRDSFGQDYDDLALDALRTLQRALGDEAVLDFARHRVAALAERVRPAVAAAAPEHRAEALAQALTAEGYAASAAPTAGGFQICQHRCPVAHVAAAFPQLCEAETEAFAELVGSHVQRLATIAHGDHVCTTSIPRVTRTPERTAR
ncbi:MAG TPA: winged helix-turn-helix transcriptional regulator [Actinomycetes bacterium]|nr:winged helix-turn-helix transcriptional regulator [Actinomycetes bacterium]